MKLIVLVASCACALAQTAPLIPAPGINGAGAGDIQSAPVTCSSTYMCRSMLEPTTRLDAPIPAPPSTPSNEFIALFASYQAYSRPAVTGGIAYAYQLAPNS